MHLKFCAIQLLKEQAPFSRAGLGGADISSLLVPKEFLPYWFLKNSCHAPSTSLAPAEAATKMRSLQFGGSSVPVDSKGVVYICFWLLQLSSAKALVQFVITENFILVEELGFISEDGYFCVSHLKSFCACITIFKHIMYFQNKWHLFLSKEDVPLLKILLQ